MLVTFNNVTVSNAYALKAKDGYVQGCIGLTRTDARARLADRKANGEAFNGEKVVRVRMNVLVKHDGSVSGYLV